MNTGDQYYITDYCLIRDKRVLTNNGLLFTGTEDKPTAFFTEIYKQLGINYPKFYKMDSLCKLGLLASDILMAGKEQHYRGDDFGVILYNAASSIDTDRTHQQSINDRNAYFPSPSVFVYTLPNIVIGEICIRHKLFGESAFFITEKFDPEELHEYVYGLFDDNVIQTCLTGWIECDANHYDCALFRIEKSATDTDGFVTFDPGEIKKIYSQ